MKWLCDWIVGRGGAAARFEGEGYNLGKREILSQCFLSYGLGERKGRVGWFGGMGYGFLIKIKY